MNFIKIIVTGLFIISVVLGTAAADNQAMTACFPNGYYWEGLAYLFKEYMDSDSLCRMRLNEYKTYYLMGINHAMMFFMPRAADKFSAAVFIMNPRKEKDKIERISYNIIKDTACLVSPSSSFTYEDIIKKMDDYYADYKNKIIPTVSLAVVARDILEGKLKDEEIEKRLELLRAESKKLAEEWEELPGGY